MIYLFSIALTVILVATWTASVITIRRADKLIQDQDKSINLQKELILLLIKGVDKKNEIQETNEFKKIAHNQYLCPDCGKISPHIAGEIGICVWENHPKNSNH